MDAVPNTLPPAPASLQGSTAPGIDGGLRRKLRVLLVEDDADAREAYAWCFRAAGWNVDEVYDGEQAYVAAVTLKPDVILMDLRLPKLDGIEATRMLKRSDVTRQIPVVACTAYVLERTRAQALEAGCEMFVAKPCAPEELCELLKNLVIGAPVAPRRAMARAFRAQDGAEFLLHPKTDQRGPYLEVLTPGLESLGTVRLNPDGRSDCYVVVSAAEGYLIEIARSLQAARR